MSDLLALLTFALIPGLLVVGSSRRQRRTYPAFPDVSRGSLAASGSGGETVIATLYLRRGRLRLRRRAAA